MKMFIKKIVSWISENPPSEFSESIGESEKSFEECSESIKYDGNWSSASTGGKTSTLEGSLGQNEIVGIQRCNNERKNLHAAGDSGSDYINDYGDIDEDTSIGTSKEGTDYKIEEKKVSWIRNSIENISVVDKEAAKKDTGDSLTKLSPTTNCERQVTFSRKVPGFDQETALVDRFSRGIFTQTGVGSDIQSNNIIMKKSNNCSSFDNLEHEKKNLTFPISELSLAHYTEKLKKPESSESLYGMLLVVGCSKIVPDHLTEKMNTKYILRKRVKANGLTEDCNFVTSDVKESLSASPAKHVISYSVDNNRSVIVTFKKDSLSDLFQIGRYEKYPIDFTVHDINPQDIARRGVSRFACRISVRRDSHEARIYAGAFDASQVISVAGNGLALDYCGKMDGFTTNGVLILKPHENCPSDWREVSVSGYIYPLRSSKMDASKRPRIAEESNVLIDGTLIDLCGVTIIWRTREGLKNLPSEHYLNHLQSTLHKHAPECSLLLQESIILGNKASSAIKKAYIYLSCGHVIGLAISKLPDNCGKGWSCPTCRAIGPIKEFAVGIEPGFYFDDEVPPSYAAFKPCGHVATQKTVKFWSSIDIPSHRTIQCSLCPFCGQKLNFITKYVKLTLPII